MIKICAAAIIMIYTLAPALAEKAHVHGSGTLNIAIEGAVLEMELQAPGFDIVGFEHAAATEADKAKIKAAYALFKTPMQLFSLSSGAVCKLSHMDVHYTNDPDRGKHAGHDDHKGHEGHEGNEGQDGHGHDTGRVEGHDTAGHDPDHDQDHDAAHKHSDKLGEHGEFHAHYKFSCANTSALSAIRFGYFKKFEGAEALKVNIITPKGQKSYEVSRDESAVDLHDLN